jgi:peptidyl-prolyl cis-trans isomerase A (cyclophilin A)
MKKLLLLTFFCLVGCGENQNNSTKKNTTTENKTQSQDSSKDVSTKSKKQSTKNSTSQSPAPDNFRILFSTTQGDFVIEVTRSWSPNGADRLYDLVQQDFFTDIAFFRAIKGFMIQFGIHGDPTEANKWRNKNIKDDTVVQSNTVGMLTFAKTGMPNSRSTQFFININNNANLDKMGFSPVGKVLEDIGGGMAVVNKIHTGYGEGSPRGKGPNQMLIQTKGNAYLKSEFPKLDYIKSAKICANPECTN